MDDEDHLTIDLLSTEVSEEDWRISYAQNWTHFVCTQINETRLIVDYIGNIIGCMFYFQAFDKVVDTSLMSLCYIEHKDIGDM